MKKRRIKYQVFLSVPTHVKIDDFKCSLSAVFFFFKNDVPPI